MKSMVVWLKSKPVQQMSGYRRYRPIFRDKMKSAEAAGDAESLTRDHHPVRPLPGSSGDSSCLGNMEFVKVEFVNNVLLMKVSCLIC